MLNNVKKLSKEYFSSLVEQKCLEKDHKTRFYVTHPSYKIMSFMRTGPEKSRFLLRQDIIMQ